MMRKEVIMPKVGLDMEEGTIQKWVKQVGDSVHVDDVLAEAETDKTITEIKSTVDGVLTEIVVPENQTVPITTVIAWIETN